MWNISHSLYLYECDHKQVRFADRFVDPAFGFCAGVNFFALEVILVPFEIVAFNLILQFWTDKIPAAAIITIVLASYAYVISLCCPSGVGTYNKS